MTSLTRAVDGAEIVEVHVLPIGVLGPWRTVGRVFLEAASTLLMWPRLGVA